MWIAVTVAGMWLAEVRQSAADAQKNDITDREMP
jgi:hypothetical protein